MKIHRWSLAAVAALVLAVSSACSFTTANISSIKLSKDKDGSTQTNTFAPNDSIYTFATVSNVPSKVTLKFRLITESVQGQPENAPVPRFDVSVEIPNDGVGTYSLSPPTAGWPAGKYRIEVGMHVESGEEKDHEAVTFTVAR
ncbi:MAG TPA: hypothetical protein VJT09_12110 [Pyrinomonadaceae bacterium]|nr:hypothetical protein [Pyrinomonadaceae bacterium]